MDSLFHPENKSFQVVAAIDPSIYLFRLPTSMAVERSWKNGVIPLWNPDNACGHPMLGMIESGAFNWYIMLFPFSSEYAYNLGIVARDLIACLGTFFLARRLGLAPLYATFAGLLLGFCPYFLRELELSKETYIYPAAFALFIHAARKRSIGWSSFLSIACGLICATMHPECSLNLVFFASFFVVLDQFFNSLGDGALKAARKAAGTVGWLALVGLPAFFIASPVLLPFLEFVRNSDCYKFDYGAPPRVPIQAFLLTLTHATCRGLSPFLGILAVPLMISKLSAMRRTDYAFLICIIVSVALTTLVGPLLEVFEHKPWNLLEPIYLQPLVMVFLSVFTAMGLETICYKWDGRRLLLFVMFSLIVVSVPWCFNLRHASFEGWVWDGGEWHFEIVNGALRRDFILVLLAAVISAICWRLKTKLLLALSLIVLISISEWTIARQSLPVHASFMPNETPIVRWLKKHPGRFLALGNHLMLPNINMCWGVSALRHNNGLFPPRFLEFEGLCGGLKGATNGYSFENALTGFINLASIRYLLSDGAVFNDCMKNFFAGQKCHPNALFHGISFGSSALQYDSICRQSFCALQFKTARPEDYIFQFAVYDSQDREVWLSSEYRLAQEQDKKTKSSCDELFVLGRWNVPCSVRPDENLRYVLRLNSIWNGAPVFPEKVQFGQIRNNVIIGVGATNQLPDLRKSCRAPFELREELAGLRIYENKKALPEAFCLRQARLADGKTDAANILSSAQFNPFREIVLEGTAAPLSGVGELKPVKLIRVNGNKLKMHVQTTEPEYLVVTDTFYPGWKALVNGREKTILRANYLFRAVQLEPGENNVEIVYEPQSFRLGLLLFGIGTMLLFLLNLHSLISRIVQAE